MAEHQELIKLYFPDFKAGVPFSSAAEERHAWLVFTDLLCALSYEELLRMMPEAYERRGVRFSAEEAETVVLPGDYQEEDEDAVATDAAAGAGAADAAAGQGAADGQGTGPAAGVYSASLEELYRALLKKGCSEDGTPKFPLSILLASLSSDMERYAVILALSGTASRKYETVFAALQEDDSDEGGQPSLGLLSDLCRYFLPVPACDPSPLFSEHSFLNRCVLRKTGRLSRRHGMGRTLVLRPYAARVLFAEHGAAESASEDGIGGACDAAPAQPAESGSSNITLLPSPAADAEARLSKARREVFSEMKGALRYGGTLELSGEAGSGRRYLLSLAAAALEKRVAVVDLQRFAYLTDDEAREELLSTLMLGARILGQVPYIHCTGNPAAYAGELRELYASLREAGTVVCIGTEKPVPEEILGGLSGGAFGDASSNRAICTATGTQPGGFFGAIYRITVPEASAKEQAALWQEAAALFGLTFPETLSIDVLVSKYVMSPGRIFETMANVRTTLGAKTGEEAHVLSGDGQKKEKAALGAEHAEIREDILEEQIRRSCSVQFGESATRLSSPFTWEDLMIPPESETLLRMAADRVRCRATVNEGFGFAKKLPYGRGVAIVLYGPPGTGKTMAAQVLAKDLGLDIYRIDLSQVSSKYIGETEKNLGAVFDAAKNSNAILFFDEADSLFSKRTEVSSSNDKYANAETSYLLQKIEEYSGVSVLATNNMQNFDAAFKRRMTFLIPVDAPDEETRVRLWKAVFPPDAPVSPEVDLELLAGAAALSGSAIKSAAVTAAYLAAGKGRAINYEDLKVAIDLEGKKAGTLGLGARLSEAILAGEA